MNKTSLVDKICLFTGTVLGLGFLPVMPGTYASFFSCVIAYFFVNSLGKPYQLIYYAIIFFVGVVMSFKIEKLTGEEDPRIIVIDEYVGQGIALIMADKHIVLYAIGFLMFRIMDIFKPFPVNRLEKVKYGFGVMLDDLMAGIYAFILVVLVRFLFFK
jgi:phosphatidylglycerophosphatase A